MFSSLSLLLLLAVVPAGQPYVCLGFLSRSWAAPGLCCLHCRCHAACLHRHCRHHSQPAVVWRSGRLAWRRKALEGCSAGAGWWLAGYGHHVCHRLGVQCANCVSMAAAAATTAAAAQMCRRFHASFGYFEHCCECEVVHSRTYDGVCVLCGYANSA